MSGCTTQKQCFTSRASAMQHARDIRSARNGGGAHNLRPYQCPECGYWHLTSMTKVEQRRARKKGRIK